MSKWKRGLSWLCILAVLVTSVPAMPAVFAMENEIPPDTSNVNLALLAVPAQGGSIIASNVGWASNPAEKMNDGKLDSGRWGAGGGEDTDHTVDLAFAGPQTINKAVIYNYRGSQSESRKRIAEFKLQYSNDEGEVKEWTDAYHRTETTILPGGNSTGSPNPNVFEFPAFTAKYVRLHIIKGYQPSIFEFQLFNDQRDPLITTTELQDGKEGAVFNAVLESRGKAPLTWTLESGALPAGLSLAEDGTISGTPESGTAGDHAFTVKAVNSYTLTGAAAPVSGSHSRQITLTVIGADIVLPIDLNVPGALTIPEGEIRRVKAADGTALTFTSNDTSVVEIENNGFILAKAPGTAVITGTASDGSGKVGSSIVTVEAPAYTDIERMRRKYRESMVPYESLDLADPAVKAAVDSVYAIAENLYEGPDGLKGKIVNGQLTGPRPWTISTEPMGTQSYPVGTHYSNVYTLTQAFLLPGKYYHDPELYDHIVITLEWLLRNVFKNSGITNTAANALIEQYGDTDAKTQGSERSANWYHYGLGIPSNSGKILTLLADTGFPEDLKEAYLERIHIFSPSSNDRFNLQSNPEAANKIDSCIIIMAHGLLADDEARVRQAANELFSSGTIETNKTGGNGYYWDGSQIAHSYWAYSLGYGISILNGLSTVVSVVGGESIDGSPITFNQTYFNNFMNTFDITYLTSVWKGAAMPGLGGRGISRQEAVTNWARNLTALLSRLYPVVPAEKQSAVKAAVKSWVQHAPEILNSTNLSQNRELAAFVSDSTPAGEWEGIFAQNNQSRVFWREDDFAFSVSTNNTNINTFPLEVGNGENYKGVHTGDGMTYLFLENDINQYAGSFFATVDPVHMPGSTVEVRADGWQAYTRDNGPNSRRNSKHTWAGTSVLTDKDGKQYGASGFLMDLSGATAEGTTAPSTLDMDVTANKSWFMLGDKIIALGSNVTSTKGRPVDTTIESRRLPSGSGVLTYNGAAVSAFDQKTATPGSYAHLSYGDGAQIGYAFPGEGQNISIGLQDHTGSWYETNRNYSNTPITEPYADIYINHGTNPSGDTYEYVLLPNYSADQTAAFAANPGYTVAAQTATLHAVYDHAAKVLLINNFAGTAATVTSPGTGINYEIDRAASVIIREHDNGQVEVGILDPTSGNNGVTVTIKDRKGYKLSGDNMTVTQNGNNIVTKVTAPTAGGKKFNTWQASLDVMSLDEEIPPPNAPRNAAVESIDAYSATLTWQEPDNAGEYAQLTYEIRYMRGGTEQVVEVPGGTTSFYVYPLEKGTAYEFSLFSKDRGTLSETSAKALGTTTDYSAPIDFEWAAAGDTVVGPKADNVTTGTIGGRPFWTFNDTGTPGENKAAVVQDGDTKALEVTSGATNNTNGQLSYSFSPINSGVFEFSFRAKASGGAGIMNGIHLLGTVNGVENVPVVSVVSDTGKWTYEIMNNNADQNQTLTNTRPWEVPVAITDWVTIRMIVDFDRKAATVLVDDKVLVKDEAFRYRSGTSAGSPGRYTNDQYTAITGFQVKTRWGGDAGNAIRVDDFYLSPQALDGAVTIDNTAPKAGDTVTATYDGYHIGDLLYTWTAGSRVIPGSSASYTVSAEDEGKALTVVVTSGYETGSRSASVTVAESAVAPGSGDGGNSPSTPTAPAYSADVTTGSGSDSAVPINVDTKSGTASVDIGSQGLHQGKTIFIAMPSIPSVKTYTVGIPFPSLSTTDARSTMTLDTSMGSVTVPSNMLTGVSGISGGKAEISIGQGDKDRLPADVKAAIGDKPLIELTLSIDGKRTDGSNPGASVTVSIPYTPTAAELANPESIVIWFIDGSGKIMTIPNGKYAPATGRVTFQTTHFSDYAVAYNKVSFKDVVPSAWYTKAVSFIAAREMTSGTGNGHYSPDARLTRGEFIVMMMRAYGIEPDANPADNFSDAGNAYYSGYLAAAKRLGITAGIGDKKYAPGKEITRQAMFTLLYNALKVIGQLPQGDSGKTLSDFADAEQINGWAKDAMSLLVQTGTVGGNAGKLAPNGTATRAEMAQVLYRLLG
ncbi:polysaccharide lyase family 8 super-sandwich domain-containing protein [Paenibacillus soyae]|uniref:S-layer homology domain-containing protein n=1 Tax=Paenibacillus soyae TaxID=2969249 RepID=A0A9X2S7P2_9BACL|nr:polysaccharide lyase family 8 super-sandwich domain-containing protein [Paenibacillus soyae]MCR2803554.1 S-layer homology domain-containing protein [Paenibacillus soyae]